MSILNKLGITESYDEMLRAILHAIDYIQSPQVFDLISPEQSALYDHLVFVIENSTGKSLDEIEKLFL